MFFLFLYKSKAQSESNLQRYASTFVRVFKSKILKINVGKSKVMKMSDTGDKDNLRIKVKGGYGRNRYRVDFF